MSDCPKCDDNPHPQRPEPKVACKHDDPPHAEVPCEFKTLGTHWELRKEEGDCPLIRVLGEDGQPCWYRVCEVAEGETGPEEDSPSIIYDCLGRYWKLQEGKDAAGIAAAMACALEAKAAIAALPPKPSKEEVNTCIAEAIADHLSELSPPTTLPDGTIRYVHTSGDGTVQNIDIPISLTALDWSGAAITAPYKTRWSSAAPDLTQYGEYISWPGYADEATCTPNAPTDCPDIRRWTCDPSQKVFYSWNGNDWSICHAGHVEKCLTVNGAAIGINGGSAIQDFFDAGTQVGASVIWRELCQTVENNSCHRYLLSVDVYARPTTVSFPGNEIGFRVIGTKGLAANAFGTPGASPMPRICDRDQGCTRCRTSSYSLYGSANAIVLNPGASIDIGAALAFGFPQDWDPQACDQLANSTFRMNICLRRAPSGVQDGLTFI